MTDPYIEDNETLSGTAPAAERRRVPDSESARMRRERIDPQRTQWDYLHLRSIRDAVSEALARLPHNAALPALDLYCGAAPYASLSPVKPVVGYDIDDHFGGADVIGSLPLPFADGAFSTVMCTQALHLVESPRFVVSEMERVLAPGGSVIITVPNIFRRDLAYERKLGEEGLTDLFEEWGAVRIHGAGGPGTGAAYILGKMVAGAARRWRWFRPVLPVIALVINAGGAVADRVMRPLKRRYPAVLLLEARKAVSAR